jgi:hypothetical protein
MKRIDQAASRHNWKSEPDFAKPKSDSTDNWTSIGNATAKLLERIERQLAAANSDRKVA